LPPLNGHDLIKDMKTKISIKTTGLESTPALVDFVNSKLAQVDRFLTSGEEVLIEVEIGKTTAHHKQGEVFRAEINLRFNGDFYRTEHVSEDLYAAIEIAKDDLINQIANRQDKKHTKQIRGGRKIKDFLRGLNPWR
jgi:ribosomal subunit interface protein